MSNFERCVNVDVESMINDLMRKSEKIHFGPKILKRKRDFIKSSPKKWKQLLFLALLLPKPLLSVDFYNWQGKLNIAMGRITTAGPGENLCRFTRNNFFFVLINKLDFYGTNNSPSLHIGIQYSL